MLVNIEGPTNTPLQYLSTFTLTCTATISNELNNTMVGMIWVYPNGTDITTTGDVSVNVAGVQNMAIMDSIIYSLDLNFQRLQASQVGTYLCQSGYIDNSGNVTVRRYFNISVQGQCI